MLVSIVVQNKTFDPVDLVATASLGVKEEVVDSRLLNCQQHENKEDIFPRAYFTLARPLYHYYSYKAMIEINPVTSLYG